MLQPYVRQYPDQWNGWIALGRLAESASHAAAFIGGFDRAEELERELTAHLPAQRA